MKIKMRQEHGEITSFLVTVQKNRGSGQDYYSLKLETDGSHSVDEIGDYLKNLLLNGGMPPLAPTTTMRGVGTGNNPNPHINMTITRDMVRRMKALKREGYTGPAIAGELGLKDREVYNRWNGPINAKGRRA